QTVERLGDQRGNGILGHRQLIAQTFEPHAFTLEATTDKNPRHVTTETKETKEKLETHEAPSRANPDDAH
ncbi:hypothetical protein, partial [Mycolicibacterium phlei]|uniref:hypothetical protein n=1 Tax=Mycolicibacterium phlei TaxID=1771 RepID=UPI001B88153C